MCSLNVMSKKRQKSNVLTPLRYWLTAKITATAVPSGCTFSERDLLVDKRSKLSQEHTDEIMMIKRNLMISN